MAHDPPHRPDHAKLARRLDILLETERSALLAGDFGRLPGLAREKDSLLEGQTRLDGVPRAQIDALRQKVTRNQMLLEGAIQGIRNVMTRLNAHRRVRDGLETYDSQGRRQTMRVRAPRIEKRA